ncbi:hypothetical protein L1987_36892 [Smallanthus sonchifolius]|uniref:Uncharacterized protein n=1 Tax=Smallanthus sonchifolius TaxID=185202 RepID=A0ACB9HFP7_9ASTR|nr:hypothetical protein L1987_36892 [Smallanthus sonchifolius]
MDCGVSGDDFFMDDLLDFPTDAAFVEENDNSHTNNHKTSSVSPVNEDKTAIPETELCLPVNDVDDLQWVSQFVDDSFSGDYPLTFPGRKFPETETETETVTLVAVNPSFKNLVHKRARSKRSRTGGSVWSLRSSSPLPDSSTSSSSTSSCTSNPLLGAEEILGKATVQMQKRKIPAAAMGSGQPQPRRCSHCLVQKTPQWRAGPLGAKTLCNACGVRFKSGRLLPEYRPACSPTFSSGVHSNNHRKVLDMRRKKAEAVGDGGLIEFEDGSERTW